MKFVRNIALLSLLLGILFVPAAVQTAQAQVAVGVGVGYPGYVYGPPVCEYGYYGYAPYACAPYGYYGPSYFLGGVFIGAGPWFRGGYGSVEATATASGGATASDTAAGTALDIVEAMGPDTTAATPAATTAE